jgi:GT2 family glycosyltransferase
MNDTLAEPDLTLAPRHPRRAAWCQFDAAWYLLATPELAAELDDTSPAALRRHYLESGAPAGLSPNMFFDEAWYRLRYPAIAAEIAAGRIASGYAHYCAIGYLTHTPHWLYDEDVYAASTTDITEAALADAGCVNRYDHYLKAGAAEGRIAHPLFDPASQQDASGSDTGGGAGPFERFLHHAWATGEDQRVSPYFDPAWFRASYPELAAEIDAGHHACALHAYLCQFGEQSGPPWRDPLAQFSEQFYRATQPEAAAAIEAGAVLSGYEYFLKFGVFALHPPAPGINLAAFLADNTDLAEAVAAGRLRDAFAALLHRPPRPTASVEAAPLAPAPPPATAPPAATGTGHLEQFGHHASAGGWLFTGWVSPALPLLADATLPAVLRFADGDLLAQATIASYPRPDIAEFGVAVAGFIPMPQPPAAPPTTLTLTLPGGDAWTLAPPPEARACHDQALAALLLPVLERLPESPARTSLVALARRHFFNGANTLPLLRQPVFLEMEEAIICPPHGLTIAGWMLAAPGAVRAIRLHCGPRHTELRLADAIRHDRPDVRDSVGAQHGLTGELRSGFIAHLPDSWQPDTVAYLEVETTDGQIAHRGLNTPRLREMEAIRFLADRVNVRYNAVPPAFDNVLGPSIAALNAVRLQTRPIVQGISFGPQPESPALSVIVTLYGRLDFMEYQFALLSRHTPAFAVEYLYVLDDPTLRWDAENLAASIYQRFRIPLRLLALDRNMGYAPANNIGLESARGDNVCFLNSDVVPATPDWMERLAARLAENPSLGAVGPLLVFEDGSVQHQGMHFERIPVMGGWHFPIHDRKGWRPPAERGLHAAPAITGACLMLRRDLALDLGGFDEAYLIGDFEDADLCLKLRARGLSSAVDLDTTLYHLERQSQTGPEQLWRRNFTLFNAWLHERRWAATLAELAPPCPAC